MFLSPTEIIDCGNPTTITDGSFTLIDGSSTEYGSRVRYQCNDPGYTIIGNEIRFCTEDATWNGTDPSCELFNCIDPGHLHNGQRKGDDFTYGSSVSYECDNGYYLLGDSIITCGNDMTWNSSVTPTCNPVSCSDPSIPTNGRMGNEFKYQTIVYYTCDSGYELVGDDVIKCQADQIWNGSLPTCVPISCGTLVAPDNGLQIGNATYTFASIVEFNCNSGYYLTGPSVLQCMANSNWDHTVPDCLPVSCEPPPVPNNGSIVGYDSNVYYSYSRSIVYQCDEGYFLNGSNVSTCQADRKWSDSVPECIELCEEFEFLNGIKTPSDTPLIPGTIIQLSCTNGYEVNGTSSIECLSNSEWNISVIPECIG